MLIKIILQLLLTTTIFFAGSGAALAQDLLPATRTITTLNDTTISGLRNTIPQVSVSRTGIDTIGVQRDESPAASCICTNNTVTVICPACDREDSRYNCVEHDQICQDTAQQGGIREHQQFFCVNNVATLR